MGTKTHKPEPSKNEWHSAHDDAKPAQGPGERPGVPSRIEAARERLKKKSG